MELVDEVRTLDERLVGRRDAESWRPRAAVRPDGVGRDIERAQFLAPLAVDRRGKPHVLRPEVALATGLTTLFRQRGQEIEEPRHERVCGDKAAGGPV